MTEKEEIYFLYLLGPSHFTINLALATDMTLRYLSCGP